MWIFVALKQLSDARIRKLRGHLCHNRIKIVHIWVKNTHFLTENDDLLMIFFKMCKPGTKIKNHIWHNTIFCISPLQGTCWPPFEPHYWWIPAPNRDSKDSPGFVFSSFWFCENQNIVFKISKKRFKNSRKVDVESRTSPLITLKTTIKNTRSFWHMFPF